MKQLFLDNKDMKLDLSRDLIKIKMRKMADEFYNSFKDTEIPVQKIPTLYHEYNSVGIIFQDGSGFAVPYYFYQQLEFDNSIDFLDIFNKNLPWLDLVSEIFERGFSVKTEINLTDVKILRALCYYKRNALFNDFDLEDQRVFTYHVKTLSSIIDMSYRWTVERINFLYNNYILVENYILNPFLFGLKTILIQYDSQHEEEMAYINPITLIKLNLSLDEVIRIIQLPNIQSTTDLSFPFPTKMYTFSEMHIFNNLSGLSEDKTKSFQKIPDFSTDKVSVTHPIIEFKDTMTVKNSYQLSDDDKEYYSLLAKMTIERRTSVIVRILGYLAKWGSVQGNLKMASKQLRVNSNEFLETCKYLFNKDIIGYFPRITRIGCNNRYGILIKDKIGQGEKELLKIYYNLLELPHSVIYLAENILFGYVTLPDTYLTSFTKYLMSLHTKFEVKYNAFVAFRREDRHPAQGFLESRLFERSRSIPGSTRSTSAPARFA